MSLPRLPTRWGWTSGPKRSLPTSQKSQRLRRSCGTDPWACSRCQRLRRERWKWPRRLQRPPAPELPPSSGEAIRLQPFTNRVWPTKSRTSPRVAVLLWSFLAAANCPAWKRFPTNNESIETTSRDCRQLEDVQDAGGDAHVLFGVRAAGFGCNTLRHRHRTAVHSDLCSRGVRTGHAHRHWRTEGVLGERRRFYRRSLRADACRSRLPLRDYWPFGAPPVLRRYRGNGGQENEGRACSRTDSHRLRWRKSCSTRGGPHRENLSRAIHGRSGRVDP